MLPYVSVHAVPSATHDDGSVRINVVMSIAFSPPVVLDCEGKIGDDEEADGKVGVVAGMV